ncbi:rhomboid family intramembrane serine protease [Nocardia sp. PE-7]|uniref:rhomboid family intramembrane serine protease n=1 Tax=Nocardia sp. PE-7 TaxID=3058426 RepID=UPI00265AAB06|nr:rhomboid family intramembrane serine protease [Nocardia sp. PE-7]WKG10671.1 rhomboid family intramembrane serine protease [Nocardia sp. PE-7]
MSVSGGVGASFDNVSPSVGASRGGSWIRAAVVILGFVGSLYVIEGVDMVLSYDSPPGSPGELDSAGIEPREVAGLDGILWAPLLHGGWDHLFANTLPLLVLGFLVLLSGVGRGIAATAIIWVIAGVGTWLTGSTGSVHVGASSIVFGWLTYLICRGWFARNVGQIVVGLVILVFYGSMLWGVLPSDPRISWQGHLFGAVGGVLAGWVLSSDERRRRRGASVGRAAPTR